MAVSNKKLQKIMTQPINQIFRFFTNKTVVQIWLYDKPDTRIEGKILGFDEYMNMVLDESAEVSVKKNTRKDLGKILLKGDTITLIMEAKKEEEE
ncbi:Small nuclear ribonucleoprotein E [Plasmodium coatneyi]|uniref:Small nuclear ribonucleoprotein E n=1 Tax=Plasmodium coatneyi TaxID=208452 RepID=A0A1B1E3E2_9APIC|nr:Small nuclear ribonucleoprotein E [Plasmodium coatneyi]ANQ09522.1 Small nuclear ribonucleoprotein E [Plasmodium coatneyi]